MSSQPNPHARPDHGPERDRAEMLHKTRKALTKAFEEVGLFRNCITCEHFIEHMEVCSLIQGPNNRPNARIIAYGCAAHSEEIPF